MAHDVFISYSKSDKATADALCGALESLGIRCWIAPRDVLPGADWTGSIIRAIGLSRLMVLVFSSHANASPHVKREVHRAFEKGLTVIPLRVEAVAPTSSLQYFIGPVHWLDALTPPLEMHLRRLAARVRALLDAPPRPAGGPARPRGPDPARPRAPIAPPPQPMPPPVDEPPVIEDIAPVRPPPRLLDRLAAVVIVAFGMAGLAGLFVEGLREDGADRPKPPPPRAEAGKVGPEVVAHPVTVAPTGSDPRKPVATHPSVGPAPSPVASTKPAPTPPYKPVANPPAPARQRSGATEAGRVAPPVTPNPWPVARGTSPDAAVRVSNPSGTPAAPPVVKGGSPPARSPSQSPATTGQPSPTVKRKSDTSGPGRGPTASKSDAGGAGTATKAKTKSKS